MIGVGISPYLRYSTQPQGETIGSLVTMSYADPDWNKNGASFTDTYGASSIQFTGSNIPNQNNYIFLNTWYSDSENIVYTADCVVTNTGATDYGCSLKLISRLSTENVTCLLGCATGVNKGQLQIYYQATVVNTPPTLASLSAGDSVRMTMTIVKNTLTFTVLNLTTLATQTTSYDFSFTYNAVLVRVRSPLYTIGLGTSGGSYTWTNLSVTTTDLTLCDLMVLGDSKSYGLFASGTNPSARWVETYAANYPSKRVYISAGSGERTANWVSKLAQIQLYNPKKLLIVAPSNDPRNGVAQATTEANITTVKNAVEALGGVVYYQNPFHEVFGPGSGIDQASLITVGTNLFDASKIIPSPWTVGDAGTYNEVDNIHPKSTAQSVIANNLLNYLTI